MERCRSAADRTLCLAANKDAVAYRCDPTLLFAMPLLMQGMHECHCKDGGNRAVFVDGRWRQQLVTGWPLTGLPMQADPPGSTSILSAGAGPCIVCGQMLTNTVTWIVILCNYCKSISNVKTIGLYLFTLNGNFLPLSEFLGWHVPMRWSAFLLHSMILCLLRIDSQLL
jgi:hypothetical protein